MEEVALGSSKIAEITLTINSKPVVCLIDTGASRSCINHSLHQDLNTPTTPLYNTRIVSATGNSLRPLGTTNLMVQFPDNSIVHKFIICQNLKRSCIIGIDFLRAHSIAISWTSTGKFQLHTPDKILIQTIDTCIPGQPLITIEDITLEPNAITTINCKPLDELALLDCSPPTFELKPDPIFTSYHPNLKLIPTIHQITDEVSHIPVTIINLHPIPVDLQTHAILAYLEPISEEHILINLEVPTFEQIMEVRLEDSNTLKGGREDEDDKTTPPKNSPDKKFITSPADVAPNREVQLDDAEVSEEVRQQFQELCEEFEDIFSKDSTDLGTTPLITMDIDTGDSPPICQKPYNLPLKHAEWVRKELEVLERAGVITRSMSPWASPIVVVPKKSAPGEPPKRRLCVDYRALNGLSPKAKKVHSNAKGIMTYVPIPKIDEIYARLRGSTIYSAFDLRSGYHHMVLSEAARPKTAFVTPTDKYEYLRCPFGLTQAPAYFQTLVNTVIAGLPFAFAYLDDVLVYSATPEDHIAHVRELFERFREAKLKLKDSKCNYLKKNIQYLGHLISGEGILPVKEKLESIREVSRPKNPKEIKQFLGLAGYYRKFIPKFSDVARPLTHLTRKDVEFIWTDVCERSFQTLKDLLMESPILIYPDPNAPYVLFTDASKYAWACVLTQEKTTDIGGEKITKNHPVTYVSGLFKGSQINWATLVKEAYAIYASVRKLTYYLDDADVTVRSDHLPLRKFLEKTTLNKKVNNWAIELSPYNLKFEYIKGIKNTLADTMSRLVEVDPSIVLSPEPEGQEFGCSAFEPMEPLDGTVDEIKEEKFKGISVEAKLPLADDHVKALQVKDSFCNEVRKKLKTGQYQYRNPYYVQNGVLMRLVVDNKQTFEVTVLPPPLRGPVLHAVHDELGHNGSPRTYSMAKRHYYWKGMKKDVYDHVKRCEKCQKYNKQVVKYNTYHFKAPSAPMKFISMDLIGEFRPPSTRGHRFALTVICMLTGYVICVPLKTKSAEEVIQAYMSQVYCVFGGSERILTDNGTEFKNKLMREVTEALGVENHVFSPPYRPQSNGRIESFHYFLKACIAKHVTPQKEWDTVVPLACAAYNFLPNEHSRESAFFLMFGRDAYLPLNKILIPRIRYLGNEQNTLSLEALRNVYRLATYNLEKARARRHRPAVKIKIKPNDKVLVKNHTAKAFEPKFQGDYRVVTIRGNQVEVQPSTGGNTSRVHITDVKRIEPVDKILQDLPKEEFGRRSKIALPVESIPDLGWTLSTTVNTLPLTTTVRMGRQQVVPVTYNDKN